jgi:hypothetical protein
MADPLSPVERLAVSAVAMLAMTWSFDPRRADTISMLTDVLPHLRKDRDFDALAAAIVAMQSAGSSVEWSFAAAQAERALVPILRRDVLFALRRLPEKV